MDRSDPTEWDYTLHNQVGDVQAKTTKFAKTDVYLRGHL
jgi:hypothetical protein